jgi:5'-nucleotidase / UDP-sugar diphosphatase
MTNETFFTGMNRAMTIRNSILSQIVLIVPFLLMISFQLQAQNLRFSLLHTSDEHSNLLPLPLVDYHPTRPNPSLGGFARLATLVKQKRAEKADEPLLLLSSGDFIGGSPFAWLILEGYSPEIELMKHIGYDATTVGNHEFDYGPDVFAQYLERSGYPAAHNKLPVIASNLSIPAGHSLNNPDFPQHHIITLSNGLIVGIFGLLGNVAYSVAPAAEPVEILDPVESARTQITQLRHAGADIIIALSHSGIEEDRILATEAQGIDIILGGHDHYQTLTPEKVNNTIILHSSYYLQKAGYLELEFNGSTNQLSILNDENQSPYLIELDSSIPEDPETAELINQYEKKLNEFLASFTDSIIADYAATVMFSEFPLVKHADLEETTVGNFVTDAMRLISSEITGRHVDVAFQANGVIRGDIIPGSMEWSKGEISFLDLVTIAGLGSGPDLRPGYPLVSFYLTEKEIFSVLEIASLLSQLMGDTYFLQFSGLRYTYDPGKATWLRIPFLNTPVPAYRAVQKIELYTGTGIQSSGPYVELDKSNEKLYHMVSDHYLTSFLPMIGEILPKLKLVLKDINGDPLSIEETIIKHHGHEFKVWEAVARYALSFNKNEAGISVMPDAYKNTQERIVVKTGMPLYIWAYTLLIIILILIFMLIRWGTLKYRNRRKRLKRMY